MRMKTKGYKAGGKMKTKGYKAGGKLPMVKDPETGKMIPEYAADGKGKMKAGGKVKKMQMGGMTDMPMPMQKKKKKRPDAMAVTGTGAGAPRRMMKKGGMMKTKGYKAGGKVRGCGMASKGVRAAKMVKMKGS